MCGREAVRLCAAYKYRCGDIISIYSPLAKNGGGFLSLVLGEQILRELFPLRLGSPGSLDTSSPKRIEYL